MKNKILLLFILSFYTNENTRMRNLIDYDYTNCLTHLSNGPCTKCNNDYYFIFSNIA